MPGPTITMVDAHGVARDVDADQVDAARMQGFTVEGDAQRAERVGQEAVDERYSTPLAKVGAFAAGVNRAVTFGASDAIGAAIDPEQARHYRGLREANPGISAAGEIGGTLLTAIPTGGESIAARALARTPGAAVSRLGSRIAGAGEGAGALGQIGASAAGAAAEGMLYGAGTGVTELALSDKPLDLERAVSTLSSHMLYGGAIGGVAGSIGKVAEIGLGKAKGAIDAQVARHEAAGITDDLALMDSKQLRAAREVEIDALKTSHKVETEALEAARVTERQTIADDIAALRREVKDTNQWATTKDVKLAAAEGRMTAAELGRINAKAEKQLAGILDNPIGVAKNPTKALDALQRQEHGLTKLLEHGDELRAAYAVDGLGGKRLAALEAAPTLLEKNRALQARIAESAKPYAPVPTSSPRLEAIEAARDALQTGKPGAFQSIPQRMVEGSTFGTVTGAIAALPIPGAALAAPMVGAAISKMVGEKVFGRLGKAASEQAARTGKAVSSFLSAAEKGAAKSIPVATKVLTSVRFAPGAAAENVAKSTRLADVFHARAAEVRSQTEYDQTGKPVMREAARADLADRLKGVAALSPTIADQLETIAARRIEFLADKLPRRPDIGGIPIGPDRWQPSDLEMRKWARYVAGVEDPSGIEERVGQGTVSIEDAEVMREVYPERLAELTRQIVDQMPTLRITLPYQKRLALSILTGTPVVAAMDPRIFSVLQNTFRGEAGPPIAKPNFGSVSSKSAPKPTPAQARGGA